MKNDIAVAFIAFNRPALTLASFDAVRQSKPSRLYVITDGPRTNHATDIGKCAQVKSILSKVDWDCSVKTNFSETNLGCKNRVISGLNWVFEHETEAIIIEDDCVPRKSFFDFSSSLLRKYVNDDRVYVVTGNNFQQGTTRGDASYYFSKYNHCWGWATWRRAWSKNSPSLTFWPAWKQSSQWMSFHQSDLERLFWERMFDKAFNSEIDTWDFGWTASVWHQGGLTATPNSNLVSNIGFNKEATHTRRKNLLLSNLSTEDLGSIIHPNAMHADADADGFVFRSVISPKKRSSIFSFVKRPLMKVVSRWANASIAFLVGLAV